MESLDQLARAQHGCVTSAQLAVQLNEHQIRIRVARGDLVRVCRSVYRLQGAPFTWQSRLMAAALAHPDAMVSHRSALMLYGLIGGSDEPPHVTVPKSDSRKRSRLRRDEDAVNFTFFVHQTRQPAAVTAVHRIPATSVSRALVDHAAMSTFRELGRLVDAAVINRLCTYDQIRKECDGLAKKGRRGIALMRAVLDERQGFKEGSANEFELRLQRVVKRYMLPAPTLQFLVLDGPKEFYIDACWPDRKVAVELDGFDARTSKKKFDDERRKKNYLAAKAWFVLSLTARMTDGEWASAISATLAHSGNT